MKGLLIKVVVAMVVIGFMAVGPEKARAGSSVKDPHNLTHNFCYNESKVLCDNDVAN